MKMTGPFVLLNRFCRALGTLVFILMLFWGWQHRELGMPLVHAGQAWWLGGEGGVPVHERTLTVMKVLNGESLQARDESGNIFTVRLAGVSAPDLAHPARGVREKARASRDYLAGLVGTNTVRVEVTLTNELKVVLGTVYCGGTNVNAAVVAAAHGEFRREFLAGGSFRARYALLQAEREALAADRRP